jgi:uncharacterized oligopeptide transporter (OPT) family protein
MSTPQEEGSIGLRSILLGGFLAVLFSVINGYLSINLGMSFGYGAIAVLLAYSLFHKMGGGSCRKELTFVLVSSSSQMAIYQTLALILYIQENKENVGFPPWMAPPKEIIVAKSLDLIHWIKPLSFLIIASAISMAAGWVFISILRDELNKSPKMIWPSQVANTSLVDACMTGGGSATLVYSAALTGFALTLLQHLPSLWGYDFTIIDLSGFLPQGVYLVISVSIAFAAIGYLINLKTSLSLMGSGLLTYLFACPLLVSSGLIDYNPDPMAFYNDLLFKYTLSPAIGVMLLGGILLSVFFLVKKTFTNKEGDEKTTQEHSYLSLYHVLVKGLWTNKVYFIILFLIFCILVVSSWMLNPFSPLHPVYSVAFAFYTFIIAGFVEIVFIAKLQGETGMGMGILATLLYDTPIFGTGYRGYTGYWSYPFMRPNPWLSAGTLPYMKYNEHTRITWTEILKAKITGWVPTAFFSIFVTLVFWKYVGFGTTVMPAVSTIQASVYLEMLATGSLTSTLNPWTFLAGGVIGALLEVFTPISMMGLGMGLFLPPHYIIPFGVGGIIRWYTDKKYGKEFHKEKGRLIVTGLMASSLFVQVIMTVFTKII